MNQQITTERPRFKTRTHEAGFTLAVALPGIDRHKLDVNLENRLLTISAERKDLDGEFENRESETRRYELKVNLHEDLDPNQIKATHHDGVLTLALQKRKELAPRKIDILAN